MSGIKNSAKYDYLSKFEIVDVKISKNIKDYKSTK